jgi:hypothetical protein
VPFVDHHDVPRVDRLCEVRLLELHSTPFPSALLAAHGRQSIFADQWWAFRPCALSLGAHVWVRCATGCHARSCASERSCAAVAQGRVCAWV